MRHLPTLVLTAAVLSLSPASAQDDATVEPAGAEAETAAEPAGSETAAGDAEPEAPPRPADAPEMVSVQGDLTECSAMLSAMSGASTSFVERDALLRSSGAWLAAANAAADGNMVDPGARAEAWSGKVQSLRFLGPHQPWLVYCGSLAEAHGLDPEPFTSRLN